MSFGGVEDLGMWEKKVRGDGRKCIESFSFCTGTGTGTGTGTKSRRINRSTDRRFDAGEGGHCKQVGWEVRLRLSLTLQRIRVLRGGALGGVGLH